MNAMKQAKINRGAQVPTFRFLRGESTKAAAPADSHLSKENRRIAALSHNRMKASKNEMSACVLIQLR